MDRPIQSSDPRPEFASPTLEANFLGYVMESPELWKPGLLSIDDFTTSLNRNTFRYLEGSEARDVSSVWAGMRAAGLLKEDDYQAFFRLLNGIVVPDSLDSTAAAVRRFTTARKARAAIEDLQRAMDEQGLDAAEQGYQKLGDALQWCKTTQKNRLEVIRADQVEETALRWLWKPYLPLGKLVHFAGNSSQAKSPVMEHPLPPPKIRLTPPRVAKKLKRPRQPQPLCFCCAMARGRQQSVPLS